MSSHDPRAPNPLGDGAAEIFDHAIALNASERDAFIKRACAGDEKLRAELVSLLQAYESAGEFLGSGDDEGDSTVWPSNRSWPNLQSPNDEIDRYRLIEPLGEGGFGTVYRAEQLQPVRRIVAVKVIKLGMDTRQVIARFEAERQALAMMDHPGIARVFDAGATQTGRPYFAMELVPGQAITLYSDANRLDIRQRLRLFIQVCQAIQHAHQKGVIHRDIKPSNVLVATQDGIAIPKVIDFGIAKATDAEQTTRTKLTEQRQMIGTPAYMSPEQAETGQTDIDTRTDIYGLGVLLYELLTGVTPFDTQRLLRVGLNELVRIIREEEPPRPSARMSGTGQAKSGLVGHRDTDARRLKSTLRGDLDWIVMKCLEKDRSRRYATASALANDVQRFLNDEPVVARPPSMGYRLGKLVRRNRAAVAAIASIVLVLIATTTISVILAMRAAEQRRRADREAFDAKASQLLAEQRAMETRHVAEFQANMLGALDADALGRGIHTHLRETLKAALERQAVGDWPNRRQRTPSEIEEELSKLDVAVSLIPGADVARRLLDEFVLGQAAKTAEQSLSAQPLVRAQIHDSLTGAYRALGLIAQAEAQCRLALALRSQAAGAETGEVAGTLKTLAWILIDQGKFREAEGACREALSIQQRLRGPRHADVAEVLLSLGVTLRRQGKYDQAEPLYQEALAIHRELFGNEHLDVANTLNSLALLQQGKNNYEAAEALFRESLAIRRKLLGDRDVIVAGTLNNLANLVAMRGNRYEAKLLFREALDMRRSLLGTEHPDVAQALYNFGVFLNDSNEPAEAEPLIREAAAIWRKTLPKGHTNIARSALSLGLVLKAQKNLDEAELLIRESVGIYSKGPGDGDASVAYALNALASLLVERGMFDEGELQFREIIARYETQLPPGHRTLARVGLASTLIKRAATSSASQESMKEHLNEAERLLLDAYASYSKSTGAPTPIVVRRCLESLVELYNLRSSLEPGRSNDARAAEWQARLKQYSADTSQVPP